MTDKQARIILRRWPIRPQKPLWDLPAGKASWLRAWPKREGDSAPSVLLGSPAAKQYRTRPDGLWINCSQDGLADVFAVEHCGSMQNLNDKRSRYAAVTSSIIAFLPHKWLHGLLAKNLHRHQYLGLTPPTTRPSAAAAKYVALPVRHLRVLYVIPDVAYSRWLENSAPAAHEFFCRHSSLGSENSARMREFLRAMSPRCQFYTQR